MSDATFSLSFRARHPSTTPPDLSAHVRLPLEIHWKAGDRKRTPTGTEVQGFRHESYWCFGMQPRENDLGASVGQLLTDLTEDRGFFDKFVDSGGKLEVYVTYGPEQPGELVAADLMRQLASRNVDLAIDWARS